MRTNVARGSFIGITVGGLILFGVSLGRVLELTSRDRAALMVSLAVMGANLLCLFALILGLSLLRRRKHRAALLVILVFLTYLVLAVALATHAFSGFEPAVQATALQLHTAGMVAGAVAAGCGSVLLEG